MVSSYSWDFLKIFARLAFCLVFYFGTKTSISGAVLFVLFFISGQNPQSAVRGFLSYFSFRDKIPNQRCGAFCLVFYFRTKSTISGAVLFVLFFISGQNPALSTAFSNYYFITFGSGGSRLYFFKSQDLFYTILIQSSECRLINYQKLI